MPEETPEKLVWIAQGLSSEPMEAEDIAEVFGDHPSVRHVFVSDAEEPQDSFNVFYQDSIYRYDIRQGEWSISHHWNLQRHRHEWDEFDAYVSDCLTRGWFDVISDKYGEEVLDTLHELNRIHGNDLVDISSRLVDCIRRHGAEFVTKDTWGVQSPLQGSLYYQYDREEYQPIKEAWDGDGRPPYVDREDWIVGPFDDAREVRGIFRDLPTPRLASRESAVYIVDCDFQQPSLEDAFNMAEGVLRHIPDWLVEAYDADRALYVGESGNPARRIATHAFGEMTDSPPPASLTRLTELRAAGIAFHTNNLQRGKELEETYAEDLSRVSTDEVFVYSR